MEQPTTTAAAAEPSYIDKLLAEKEKAGKLDEQKKKGGRPPGRKNNATLAKEAEAAKAQGTVNTTQPPAPSLAEEIKSLKAEATATTTQQPQQPGQAAPLPGQPAPAAPQLSAMFTGHLLLIVIDSYFPLGLSFILNRFAGYDTNAADLRLSEKDKEHLLPMANEIAKMIVANPFLVFGLSLVGCYLGRIPKKPKRAKKEKEDEGN